MQAHDYAHIKCNQSKFMSLLPLLVCFSCPRIMIHLFSSMLLPLFVHVHVQPLLLCLNLSPKLSYLCIISPPLSSIFTKRCASLDTKGCIEVDGWHLNLAFLWTSLHMLEWHHLDSSWDTTHRIFDLDTNRWGTSPYVIAWVIHLINLSSCWWGNFLYLMIT